MTLWYVARAAGLVALAALTLATALGAFASIREPGNGPATLRWRFALQYVHRAAAGTGLLLLVAHIGALVLDSSSGVDLRAVVVPFTASYRPFAVGLGSFALLATVVTAVVGAARGRLATSVRGARLWRGVHLTSYAAWAMAMIHGFLAGTDRTWAPISLAYVIALLTVAISVSCRVWSHRRTQSGRLAQGRRAALQSRDKTGVLS